MHIIPNQGYSLLHSNKFITMYSYDGVDKSPPIASTLMRIYHYTLIIVSVSALVGFSANHEIYDTYL